ncbi:signal peptidase I [Acuticoccus mangrovi]|uniref:Signal peptidase I n=1 Tax=Acuticoccus mangrovi TaxID=2796142 RepID=A0A934IT82_9HYPH|nr:signal peptidase I [Acuticoccus mangrovi]MBJ3778193.1 signal peptidase I [Acuticoccus mangrovi]
MSVAKDKTAEKEGGLYETVKVIIQALLIAFVIRTFLFQPFNIPSASMVQTLLVGDYLFVSKYAYGYSRYSIPFGIVPIPGRIFASQPKRGDIAVFKLPKDNSTDYIKRVIGLPGDEIQVTGGVLYINGEEVPRERVADYVDVGPNGREFRAPRYRETLPNGVSYEVLDTEENGLFDNTGIYKVPEGHYFMMGDNRDNSTDSRAQAFVGYVPFENFVGRAEVIFFSIREDTPIWQVWNWPWAVRWGRIFDSL